MASSPGADWVATISADEYTTALPLAVAMDEDSLLVYEMNGQVLPREHGYPARILVPGRYGMKNAKWVVALRPMRREFVDWYGQRSWSREAIVKTMTRIDIPNRDARLAPGPQRIAGIAYAGDRGIQMVEFSADGGDTWEIADALEELPGTDVWMRWEGRFTLAPAPKPRSWRAPPTAPARCSPSPSAWPSPTAPPAGTPSWSRRNRATLETTDVTARASRQKRVMQRTRLDQVDELESKLDTELCPRRAH